MSSGRLPTHAARDDWLAAIGRDDRLLAGAGFTVTTSRVCGNGMQDMTTPTYLTLATQAVLLASNGAAEFAALFAVLLR